MQTINEAGEVEYDELNSFYLLVHIMKVLNYRTVCDKNISGLMDMIKIVQ